MALQEKGTIAYLSTFFPSKFCYVEYLVHFSVKNLQCSCEMNANNATYNQKNEETKDKLYLVNVNAMSTNAIH